MGLSLVTFFLSPSKLVSAATATANLGVSATVSNNCSINTTPVVFPAYDPISTHATSPDDSTGGSVTIACTKGATTTIGLSLGSYSQGLQARMSDGGGGPNANYLGYVLYQNSGRTNPWGNAAPTWFVPPAAPSKAPRTYTVYGRIPAGQDVPSGTYSDTVTATVQF